MYMINRRGQEDVIYWCCHRSRNCHCTGSITTGPGDAIVSVKDSHNHPPDQASIEVKQSRAGSSGFICSTATG